MRLLCWSMLGFMVMALIVACCNVQLAEGDIDDNKGMVNIDDNVIKGDKPEVIK